MALGDLGADVLKVERPGTGDETRGWGPPFDPTGESAYYLAINRNKLSVALDLDDEADRDLLRALAAGADVVVENFRSGMLRRRGLDPAALLEAHPRADLVQADGIRRRERPPRLRRRHPGGIGLDVDHRRAGRFPDEDRRGAGRRLRRQGRRDRHPRPAELAGPGLPAGDRLITISLAHSATAALVNVAQNALVTGREPVRWGNAHPNLVPYQLFDAADRPIVLAVGNDAQWQACCRALDRPDLGGDDRYRTNAGRVERRSALVGDVAETLRTRTAAEWLDRLAREAVPAGVVRRVSEALADVPADPRTGVAPVGQGTVRMPPPRLDEHGAAVRSLGWKAFEKFPAASGRA